MRSDRIVVPPPCFDHDSGFEDRVEDPPVKKLIAELVKLSGTSPQAASQYGKSTTDLRNTQTTRDRVGWISHTKPKKGCIFPDEKR